MIDWQKLYNVLLETKQSLEGEQHHIIPRHAGGKDENGIVRLPRRYHVLAHYIRYRWLQEQGDRVAFKMMSGQLKNPMHDTLIKAKHKSIMQTPEQRQKYKKPKSPETREALSQARKRYVSGLENTQVMTQHMQTPEIIEKRRLSIVEGNKQNPGRVLERAARAGQARKEKNKLLSAEELKAQYGSPTITNGKWRGYVVIEKHGTREIYETIKQAAQVLNLAYSTMLNAIKKGTGTEKSILYGTTIYLSKDIK